LRNADKFGREVPGLHMRERWNGFYALNISHPVATLARALRSRSRTLRGTKSRNEQPTCLPRVAWSNVLQRRKILLTEIRKSNGNVTLGELAVLAQAAAGIRTGTEVIEIGTFDGRSAMNLALNAPWGSPVLTLDLPPHQPTRFQLEEGEGQYVEKRRPGMRLRQCRASLRHSAERIVQLVGDSATFDWSCHFGKAGLVFVDGSHAYDYVQADSKTAMRLVDVDGLVLWHDYGVWDGVTRALEDLERTENLGLRHIRGTSLVLWRAPGRSSG
jgi:hypothetical protein